MVAKIEDWEMVDTKSIVARLEKGYKKRIVGQNELNRAILAAVIAGGHLLVEAVPGLAKTLSAKTIAEAISGNFSRIQCTPDMLPGDIIGGQTIEANGEPQTHLGPINANLVLLDEINRSSARTQSAMLEAMQEGQVSIGGRSYTLPKPFVVIATENPVEQDGVFRLSNSQLDRFLFKVILDFPSLEEERKILDNELNGKIATPLTKSEKVSADEVAKIQEIAKKVEIPSEIKNLILNIAAISRSPSGQIEPHLASYIASGISPRGVIALARVAQALALMNDRKTVTLDDIESLLLPTLRHRISLSYEALASDVNPDTIIKAIYAKANAAE